MRRLHGQLRFSPTDLVRFMENPFITWMDRFDLENPGVLERDQPSEEMEIVWERGNQHEVQYLNTLEASERDVLRIEPGTEDDRERTIQAMKEGRQVTLRPRRRRSPR